MSSLSIQVQELNSDFAFYNISLSPAIQIDVNVFFTKIMFKNKPLYIQIPKCALKQGFIKAGKNFSCDLMVENTATETVLWF